MNTTQIYDYLKEAVLGGGKQSPLYISGVPGTGKTATFSIGILQQVDNGLAECQALVLAPTRDAMSCVYARTLLSSTGGLG